MKEKSYATNQDIRDYMADHGVTQKMLGEHMGKYQKYISYMLQKELTQKEKDELLNHIDAIAADRQQDAAEAEPEEVAEETPAEEPEEIGEGGEDVTRTTKFQVGDRVKLPAKTLTIGIVCDIWHSLVQDKMMYAVDIEGGNRGLYAENQLEPAPLPIEYTFNCNVENNVAVVCMIAHQGDRTWVHARVHAHILHDGAVGMAQAVSFASKRMFESLDTKSENRIYFKESK